MYQITAMIVIYSNNSRILLKAIKSFHIVIIHISALSLEISDSTLGNIVHKIITYFRDEMTEVWEKEIRKVFIVDNLNHKPLMSKRLLQPSGNVDGYLVLYRGRSACKNHKKV